MVGRGGLSRAARRQPAMDAISRLIEQRPLIAWHLAAALLALLIGGVVLARRKGSFSHKTLGWIWVTLMAATALSSFFIRDHDGPNIAGFSPIHFFTALTAVMLPLGIRRIRQGRVGAHRQIMRGLFIGACVVAGLFTLLPGRFLGRLLWHNALGLVA
jgi:uncharacterized membrane protein